MDDCDWLTKEIEQSEREYEALPESARPEVVPSAEAVRDGRLLGEEHPRSGQPASEDATSAPVPDK